MFFSDTVVLNFCIFHIIRPGPKYAESDNGQYQNLFCHMLLGLASASPLSPCALRVGEGLRPSIMVPSRKLLQGFQIGCSFSEITDISHYSAKNTIFNDSVLLSDAQNVIGTKKADILKGNM